MSKKFSIIKTIDLDKLSDEIEKHILRTGEIKPYIFMHKDTADTIGKEFGFGAVSTKNADGIISYEGHRVFIDNDLGYGEIEIR